MKKNFVLAFVCTLLIAISISCKTKPQVDKSKLEADSIKELVKNGIPQFEGGGKAMVDFFQKNMNYPSEAKVNKITGTVYVRCIIDSVGGISKAKVMKGIDYGCDEEALRLVKEMPKWMPAEEGGVAVTKEVTIPVRFYIPPVKQEKK